jgi:AraC-like DNA-binding protein
VPRDSRLDYWNGIASSLLAPLEFDPRDRTGFDGSVSFDTFGCVDVFRTSATPTAIAHAAFHVARTKERRFYLMMPSSGSLRFSACGNEVVLDAGDFTLFDSAAPFRMELGETNHSLNLVIAPEVLRRYLPDAERFCGLRMVAGQGLNATIAVLLRSLWTLVERGAPSEPRPVIARSLLDLVAASYALELDAAVDESTTSGARRAQVRRHIESHLQDPGLGPESIAASLRLSTRYLRQLFADEPETVPHYILRRRLEECAQRLTHQLWRNRSVTDIAFAWGFVSTAHFARVFKERFGATPTAYRRAALERPSS